ncbi:MAG: ATP-dependent dethiobiotin synthetase BioD [Bacteroidetes bacterium]|nr:ATP-dependent dethiobiotin synthetase BioD [Bacteroidota bacterium]
MHKKEYFVSGIDTDCGKTYITGLLAYKLKKSGIKIITSKLVQTGCQGISEDILEHRRIMKSEILSEDKSGLTCPFVYSFPASPHLSAKIDNKPMKLDIIRESTKQLLQNYDIVLAEGAGGLMVPITENYLTIDYIKENNLPLILVSSSKLGSINHTLLSIELCLLNKINLHAVIYNKLPDENKVISKESFKYIASYLKTKFPNAKIFQSDLLEVKKLFEL